MQSDRITEGDDDTHYLSSPPSVGPPLADPWVSLGETVSAVLLRIENSTLRLRCDRRPGGGDRRPR